jgi:hypothetical protein
MKSMKETYNGKVYLESGLVYYKNAKGEAERVYTQTQEITPTIAHNIAMCLGVRV